MTTSRKNTTGTLCLPADDALLPGVEPAALHSDPTRFLPLTSPDTAEPGGRLKLHTDPTFALPAPAEPPPPAPRRPWYRRKDAGATPPPPLQTAPQAPAGHVPTLTFPADADTAAPEPTLVVAVDDTRIVGDLDGTETADEPTVRLPLPHGEG